MPRSKKDLLREKSIKEFLAAMGVNQFTTQVTCAGDWFSFSSLTAERTIGLTSQLKKTLQAEHVEISLTDIIYTEIYKSRCTRPDLASVHRKACKILFDAIRMEVKNIQFHPETVEFELGLFPSMSSRVFKQYAEMFKQYTDMFDELANPRIRFTAEGRLLINISSYLNSFSKHVIKITGVNDQQLDLVIFNARVLEFKRIFYALQACRNDTIEVTPYFYVPNSPIPPQFHYYLRVSSDLGKDEKTTYLTVDEEGQLIALKKLVCKPDEKICIEVNDGNSKVLVKDSFVVKAPSLLPALVAFGISDSTTSTTTTDLDQTISRARL